MYNWITKYQWIIILCILLYFLFVSINKKECFSVGGQGNKNDISISKNLFLKDVCHKSPKLVNGSPCVSNASCQSNFCYPLNTTYTKSTCQTKSDGTVENAELCINYDNLIENINSYLSDHDFDNDINTEENMNFLKKYFSEYNSSFICKNTPKSNVDNDDLKIVYNDDDSKDTDIYRMCEEFNNILPNELKKLFNRDNYKHIPCYQFLNMSYCDQN